MTTIKGPGAAETFDGMNQPRAMNPVPLGDGQYLHMDQKGS
jgi:hypothetical protein